MKPDPNDVLASMDREGREFLRLIVNSDSPTKANEAKWLLGLYDVFPGTTMAPRDQPLVELPVVDDPETQIRLELWE